MDTPFDNNPELAMADAFVRHTGAHIFLTGKAGTGKTTFLDGLRQNCHKQIMITAPTGVAAINAGGMTLHSFFQLPFGPCIPGQTGQSGDSRRFFRFSKEKKRIIKGLDLLVIDEISMVRADLLDAVDGVLRRLRRDDRPFGGVQLLLIGDLFQLPPVAKAEEWQLLQAYYPSIYFFASQALAQTELITIELKTIYRQSDPDFIDILNAVRENCLTGDAADRLNRCADKPAPEQGAIILTTHNRKADDINREHLDRLESSPVSLTAEVEGEFPDHSFPTHDRLVLKRGAQVMFLRNDPSQDKLYYNGKIGRVREIHSDRVLVEDPDGRGAPVAVKPVDWENITYTVNEADQTIEEKVIGRFSQFPLKLAWAVTIHKSQGLTFDRAVVDAKNAFAHGQTYVALSRCRTLDGLVLTSPLPPTGVGVDPAVAQFMAEATTGQNDLEQRFNIARMAFQQDLLLQCYDFGALQGMFFYLMRLAQTHQGSVRVAGLRDIPSLKAAVQKEIFEVGEKFQNQLKRLMDGTTLPDDDTAIKERTQKASGWFGEKFTSHFSVLLENGQVETDNKALKKQLTNALETFITELRIRMAGIQSCDIGFSSEIYLRAVSGEGMAAAPKAKANTASAPDYTELDIAHPEVFKALKAFRAGMAQKLGVPHFQIMHQKVLVQIAVALPDDVEALSALKGVGPKTVDTYGDDILALVRDYRKEHGIETVALPEPKAPEKKAAPKKEKGDTKQITLSLFETGMTPEAIAEERGLALSTIQGHLCHFIETGKLALEKLVNRDRQTTIEGAIQPGRRFKEVKEALGKDFSYGEIRAVLAHQKFLSADDEA